MFIDRTMNNCRESWHGNNANNLKISNVKYSKVWQAFLCGRTYPLQIESQFDSSVLLRDTKMIYRSENIEDKGLPAPPRGSYEELQHSN